MTKVRKYKSDPPQREMYEMGDTTGEHDMTCILVRTHLCMITIENILEGLQKLLRTARQSNSLCVNILRG